MKKSLILFIISVSFLLARPSAAKAFSLGSLFGSKNSAVYKQCVQSATEQRSKSFAEAKQLMEEKLQIAKENYDRVIAQAKNKQAKTAANKALQTVIVQAKKEYGTAEKNVNEQFKQIASACKK